MNVLLTSVGRRNYLIEYFKQALGDGPKVYAADMDPGAPAMSEADAGIVVPPISHPDYPSVLLEHCLKHQVRLVVPLNDLELPILSGHRERFRSAGVELLLSAPGVINVCFDKLAMAQFLRQHNLPTPRTFGNLEDAKNALSTGELSSPLVLKARWGSASLGLDYVDDPADLADAYAMVRKRLRRSVLGHTIDINPSGGVVVQPRLDGVEHHFDVLNDLTGNFAATLVKRKLSMRAGETDRAVTIRDESLERLGESLAAALGHVGVLDCDVIVTKEGPQIIDLNPRFGGGYPFSHVAGANFPAAILAWMRGERPDERWLRVEPGRLSAKCDRIVSARTNLWPN